MIVASTSTMSVSPVPIGALLLLQAHAMAESEATPRPAAKRHRISEEYTRLKLARDLPLQDYFFLPASPGSCDGAARSSPRPSLAYSTVIGSFAAVSMRVRPCAPSRARSEI